MLDAEQRLGLRLPIALRSYYRIAGHLGTLNQAHNILFSPAQLTIEEGYLMFMEENQAVVHWGMKVQDVVEPDPEVWQRVNCEPPEWYSEELSFSAFLTKMFAWQAGEIDDG